VIGVQRSDNQRDIGNYSVWSIAKAWMHSQLRSAQAIRLR